MRDKATNNETVTDRWFRKLESKAPKVNCPECNSEMIIEGMTLASKKDPTFDISYTCYCDECSTALEMKLDINYMPIKARVTTGNHGYQEMYDADLNKVIV